MFFLPSVALHYKKELAKAASKTTKGAVDGWPEGVEGRGAQGRVAQGRVAGSQPGRQQKKKPMSQFMALLRQHAPATMKPPPPPSAACATCVQSVCAGSAAGRRHVSTDQLVISFCSAAAAAAGNPYKPNMLTKHEKQN